MAKRKAPLVTLDTPVESIPINLNTTVVRDRDGVRITDEYAEDLIAEVRRGGGRPALSDARGPSPSVAFRLPPELLAATKTSQLVKAKLSPNWHAKHWRPDSRHPDPGAISVIRPDFTDRIDALVKYR